MEKVTLEEVLSVVKQKGPCLPREIVKTLGKSDTLMIGAILSELINLGKVKVTNTKIGLSPTYYIPGQEQNFIKLSEYLNQKDKRTYELLKEKKILRDSKLDTLIRVSLRNIKDFAKPIEIKVNNTKEIFWRWYLLTNNEAIQIIKNMFGQKTNKPKEKKEENLYKPIKEEPKKDSKEIKQEFYFKKPEEKPIEAQPKLNSEIETHGVKNSNAQDLKNFDETEFLTRLRSYFNSNNIQIDKEFQIKKNSEYNFLIKIPSAFGKINFFCKAKSKKKNNENDVASAYLAADEHRLPTIFITTGEFTKKALKELEKFKNITIKKI